MLSATGRTSLPICSFCLPPVYCSKTHLWIQIPICHTFREFWRYSKVNHATWVFCQTSAHFMRNTKAVDQVCHLCTILIPFSKIGLKNTCEPFFVGVCVWLFFSFFARDTSEFLKKTYMNCAVYNSKKWCTMRPMVHKCPYFLIPWVLLWSFTYKKISWSSR